jgi:hypothetical protein
MELTYDWKNFQKIFYPAQAASVTKETARTSALYCVIQNETVVSALGQGEDLTEWYGSTVGEFKDHFSNREVIGFDQKLLETKLAAASLKAHYLDQLQFLKSEIKPKGLTDFKMRVQTGMVFKPHFLLTAIESWWSAVLPSSYGVFIRLQGDSSEGSQNVDFFLMVRRGVLEFFHEPDLSILGSERGSERAKIPSEVVKYLSEKYMVPVQGIFAQQRDWVKWCGEGDPWLRITSAIKSNRAQLVPFRWSLVSLVASRAFVGV